MKVLITDADQRGSLVILRALSQNNVEAHVAGHQKKSISFYSRYSRKRHLYRDPFKDEQGFVRDIKHIVLEIGAGLIIPTTDRTLIPLSRHRDVFEGLSLLAIPSDDSLWQTLKKELTLALAESLHVPFPRSYVARRIEDLKGFARHRFRYPVVVKPSQSKIWKHGRGWETSVRYAHRAEDLEEVVSRTIPLCPVILQEYTCGVGVGIEMLRWDGEIVAAFQHRRIREYPLTGGASTLRESEALDPVLHDYAARLMDALSWNGVAMVEFKHDPESRKAYLMEINGRFWGSLALAIASEVNFPWLLVQLYQGIKPQTVRTYKYGLRCRHLETDLLWLKDFVRNPAAQYTYGSLQEGLKNFFRMYQNGLDRFDIQNLKDPRPGIVSLARLIVRETNSAIVSMFWGKPSGDRPSFKQGNQ